MSARSALVRQLECHCCAIEGVRQPFPTEAHHANKFELAGHERMGDDWQIPLCGHHHRGLCLPGMTLDEMCHVYGPSLAHSKKLYRFTYGSDEQMRAITNHKLDRLMPATA